MFKRNIIALSRMLGIPGLVVMTEQGAFGRSIVSDTLTITNGDGADGDIQIEYAGGGGGAGDVDIRDVWLWG